MLCVTWCLYIDFLKYILNFVNIVELIINTQNYSYDLELIIISYCCETISGTFNTVGNNVASNSIKNYWNKVLVVNKWNR